MAEAVPLQSVRPNEESKMKRSITYTETPILKAV